MHENVKGLRYGLREVLKVLQALQDGNSRAETVVEADDPVQVELDVVVLQLVFCAVVGLEGDAAVGGMSARDLAQTRTHVMNASRSTVGGSCCAGPRPRVERSLATAPCRALADRENTGHLAEVLLLKRLRRYLC